jgi:hypothetical protein
MWAYDDFMTKTKTYFSRLDEDDLNGEESTLWLLLGLEFLLRAPLAKVSPALLALPEGDSLLHSVGIIQGTARPKSVPIKTVVDRLTKIDPSFGADRGKEALFLSDLRNSELHSAEPTIANIPENVWMPSFISVVEAVCTILDIGIDDLLSRIFLEHAKAVSEEADRSVQRQVQKAIEKAKIVFASLLEDEKARRIAAVRPDHRTNVSHMECPACGSRARIECALPGRSTKALFIEDDQQISYTMRYVVESLGCPVCGLSLSTTAQVMAAGISRLHDVEMSEDRYEGWEDLMTYEDALKIMSGEYDYQNE